MRIRKLALWPPIFSTLLASCSETTPAPAPAPDAPSPAPEVVGALPDWMAQRSVQWAQRPWGRTTEVGAVWRVRHAGRDAWLIDAPGIRHDTLVHPDGGVICKPAGFGAIGDGTCPTVADAGSTPRLVWRHPGNARPVFGPSPEPMPEATSALTAPPLPRDPLPGWLEARIDAWERDDASAADALSVTRIRHRGATAYLVYANCCDRYNTLYDVRGRELCSPSGGFTGGGDERCPNPEDPGTREVKVWQHPGLAGD